MKYDWKKTSIKALWVLGEVVVAGAIAYVTERPELLVIAPILEVMLDYIKHRNK